MQSWCPRGETSYYAIFSDRMTMFPLLFMTVGRRFGKSCPTHKVTLLLYGYLRRIAIRNNMYNICTRLSCTFESPTSDRRLAKDASQLAWINDNEVELVLQSRIALLWVCAIVRFANFCNCSFTYLRQSDVLDNNARLFQGSVRGGTFT